MSKVIAAYTKVDSVYPAYINLTREDDGSVTVTLRNDPKVYKDSFYICGFAKDKGAHGRCTPGDERCNNYCNMAPEKGRMQNSPAPCVQVNEGVMASVNFSELEFDKLFGESELVRLTEILNTPTLEPFSDAVVAEAKHQRYRWGDEQDAKKTAWDWFWTLGHLGSKAAHSALAGDWDKAKHHTIIAAALLANWHRHISEAAIKLTDQK